MTTVNKTVTLEELGLIIKGIDRKIPAAMRVVIRAAVSSMIRDVAVNRMSGQYLGIVTGTARRSVYGTGSVSGSKTAISGAFGSALRYVRAHEEGFQGPVQVRAHTRRLAKIAHGRGKRAGKLTKSSQKALKERLKAKKSTTAHVRAHTRQVFIRARRFFRDTLLQEVGDMPALLQSGRPPLEQRIEKALLILAQTGKPPKTTDLKAGSDTRGW